MKLVHIPPLVDVSHLYDYERTARWGRLDLEDMGVEDSSERDLLRMIEDGAEGGRALRRVPPAIDALYGATTPAAVPVLKRAVFYPLAGAKIAAFALLSHTAGESEAGFYLDVLNDRRFPHKAMPMDALGRWGGPEAIGAVVRRAKVVLRKEHREESGSEYELVFAVRLLARHPDAPGTRAFLGFLSDRWDRVLPHERWSIADLLSGADLPGVWDGEPEEAPVGPDDALWDYSTLPPVCIIPAQGRAA